MVTMVKSDGRKTKALTRAQVRGALAEYHARYGEINSACFNPSLAKWRARPDLRERYYDGREDGRMWPSLNAIKAVYNGSFNDAVIDAGLVIAKPGGPRRAAGSFEPIREHETIRTVVVPSRDDAKIAKLRKELRAMRSRAEFAERQVGDLRNRAPRRSPVPRVIEKVVEDTAAQARIAELEQQLTQARDHDRRLADAEHTIAELRLQLVSARSAATRAQQRAEQAENARKVAERRLHEPRQLKKREVADLTGAKTVPAGPAVMKDALEQLARARAGHKQASMREALTIVARAAMTWRDRL